MLVDVQRLPLGFLGQMSPALGAASREEQATSGPPSTLPPPAIAGGSPRARGENRSGHQERSIELRARSARGALSHVGSRMCRSRSARELMASSISRGRATETHPRPARELPLWMPHATTEKNRSRSARKVATNPMASRHKHWPPLTETDRSKAAGPFFPRGRRASATAAECSWMPHANNQKNRSRSARKVATNPMAPQTLATVYFRGGLYCKGRLDAP